MHNTCHYRRGYTIVELLVAIAIIALLIGLILPAVQKVRDSASRMKCGNNLKQLGLALHLHHDSMGSFPAGFPNQSTLDLPQANWLVRLLPYIEQEPLWNETLAAYRISDRAIGDAHKSNRAQIIRLYTCPSDAVSQYTATTLSFGTLAFTSYLGVQGTHRHRNDGVLAYSNRCRMTDIPDGTSQTLAIGERPPSNDLWYGWWYFGVGQDTRGSAEHILGVRETKNPYNDKQSLLDCPAGPYHFEPIQPNWQCNMFRFWSHHANGAQFCFADGSVHFLPYSSDEILPALATRAGGEVVDF